MSTGVYALIGVIIGGLLNGIVAAVLGRARERQNARAAARLLRDDMLLRHTALMRAGRKSLASLAGVGVDDSCWRQHRDCIARVLSEDEWRAVSGAYVVLAGIVDWAAEADTLGLDELEWRLRLSAEHERVQRATLRASIALRKLTRRPPIWRIRQRVGYARNNRELRDQLAEIDRLATTPAHGG